MLSIRFTALPFLIAAGLLAACTNSSNTNNSAVPPGEAPKSALESPPPSAKPEIYLYVNKVDKLNLRDQPNKGGKVITQLKEGEFVEASGEVSPNKEKATLRGVEWNEPYYKVVSTTPEQYTGWAYGGALQPVYSGPRATSPDLGKLSQLSMYLKTLDTKKVKSGQQAWAYVKTNFATTRGTLADAAFLLLEQFLFRMETEGEFYKITEKIQWADADYQAIAADRFDMKKYPATQNLGDNGFRLATGEGMVFPVVDWKNLLDFFVDKVTPPMKSYLRESELEHRKEALDDGGFTIPMEEVADRAVVWEKFNRDHPYFVLRDETLESQRYLLHALTNGADNTPVFAGEGGQVSDEFTKMWKYVQQKYPGTMVAQRVKEFSDLVTAEGGKSTAKVEQLQQRYSNEVND